MHNALVDLNLLVAQLNKVTGASQEYGVKQDDGTIIANIGHFHVMEVQHKVPRASILYTVSELGTSTTPIFKGYLPLADAVIAVRSFIAGILFSNEDHV